MRSFVQMVIAATTAVAALGCSSASSDRASRCESVNTSIAQCLGKGSALFDCSTVSDADLSAAEAVTGSSVCQVAADQPIDGDTESASCRMYGVDCANPIMPAPKAGATRYPIVLVNGIDSSPLFRYDERIVRALESQGNKVYMATLTPYVSTRTRAPELQARIAAVLKESGAAKIDLVCHSLGGLDCRYVASPNGLAADQGLASDAISSTVASITTIGTAHHGTRVADSALGVLPGDNGGATVDAFATALAGWFDGSSPASDADVRAALQSLSTSATKAFDAEVVDAEGVMYQSWAGITRPNGGTTPAYDARVAAACAPTNGKVDGNGLSLDIAADWIALPLLPLYNVTGNGTTDADDVEPNDGVATVTSAHWGRFRGCVPADHMEQLGQFQLPDVNVRTGVDIASFYAAIATDLAAQGF